VAAINGQKLAPALADRYLGENGYDAQMTAEPVDPNRPDNLWEPLPGDHGAHGGFDAKAHKVSWQLELNMHRTLFATAVVALAAGMFTLFRRGPQETIVQKAA